MGPGFAREVYMEALALELVVRKVPFRRNIQVPLTYKDAKLIVIPGVVDVIAAFANGK